MKVFVSETNINELLESIYNLFKPEVTQTADLFSIDRNNAIDSGYIDCISKPIIKENLIQLIQNYFARFYTILARNH